RTVGVDTNGLAKAGGCADDIDGAEESKLAIGLDETAAAGIGGPVGKRARRGGERAIRVDHGYTDAALAEDLVEEAEKKDIVACQGVGSEIAASGGGG